MRAQVAQLAGRGANADRVFVTEQAVVVLDGASAFVPVQVDPASYAECLGERISERLRTDPDATLPAAVAAAIRDTVAELGLTTGPFPSSTVAILRARPGAADLFVLGDSPIHYGTRQAAHLLADGRLDMVARAEGEHYTRRLRAGHGYDDGHLAAMVALQRAQRAVRNRPGGYWIAEVEPGAAFHGVTATLAPHQIGWAVLATDGAADLLDHAGHDWSAVAQRDSEQLAALLRKLDEWEATADPDGRDLPRPKRHDDKTIAAIASLW